MAISKKQTTTATQQAQNNNAATDAASKIASALKQAQTPTTPTPSTLPGNAQTPTPSTLPGSTQKTTATPMTQQQTSQTQQNVQEPVAGERVENPNDPYKAVYVDANGQKQNGYIINGVTYTDQQGTNPVGVGSVVTDQSGREWIKTENGSMLYSEYLAQQTQTQPQLTVPERVEDNTDYAANLRELLGEWKSAAEAGAIGQIDFATQQAITELERALEDAQPQFKTQQDQIAADKQTAQDNAALYAEMRGDKGGIGQAQYNAIANAAAINRQTVASQQTKLSTDTARQIADLRAQGEFEKADKILEITQTYLSQLMSIEQWGMEFGLTVDQFNEAVRQWEAEYQLALDQYNTSKDQWQQQFDESIKQWEADYEMGVAGLTGMFNGQLTLDGKEQISDIAAALLDAGMTLSDQQLASLGMTREQANAYVAAQQAAASGGVGGNTATPQESALIGTDAWYQQLYNTYGENAGNMLKYYYKDLGISSQSLAEDAWKGYSNWLGKQKYGSKSEYDKTGLGDTNSDFLALQAQAAARKQEGYSNQSIRNLISDAYSAQKISLAQRNMLLAMYP